jgi:DNA-binding MarR family transcriptional regulator
MLREADKEVRRQLRVGERERLVAQAITRICEGSGVREQEVRSGGRRRGISRARAEISYYLSHELGVPAAEIARHLGVCTSSIVKSIQNIESGKEK